ncbi:MAG: GNAT family N-acetyltransferase [Atopobiaceae bacterium]|nr:GNAT family N-acetyltransferase [Atopobiaceae bacterium]
MQIDDYEEVYNLWLSCKGMGLNNLDDSKEGIAAFLKRNPTTCFVVVEQEKIIGTIISGHDGRRGYIYHTAVSPIHRHKGIGTQLVEHALAALQNEGINKVGMLVFKKNVNGNTFWEAKGFDAREDVLYRNKQLTDIVRIDT